MAEHYSLWSINILRSYIIALSAEGSMPFDVSAPALGKQWKTLLQPMEYQETDIEKVFLHIISLSFDFKEMNGHRLKTVSGPRRIKTETWIMWREPVFVYLWIFSKMKGLSWEELSQKCFGMDSKYHAGYISGVAERPGSKFPSQFLDERTVLDKHDILLSPMQMKQVPVLPPLRL